MASSCLPIVLTAAKVVTVFAQRRNIPAPLLRVPLGPAASFMPGPPRFERDPGIILTIVLPYAAADALSFKPERLSRTG